MHGHGYAPPQPGTPSSAVLITLRVLFVALALLTCGLLAWGTMLRIAVMRRRRTDWLLFWLSLALSITTFVVIGIFGSEAEVNAAQEAEPRPVDYVCMAVLFGMALGVPVHYLVADIRHYQQPRPAWNAYGPPAHPMGHPVQSAPIPPATPAPGYGYPPAQPIPPQQPHQAQQPHRTPPPHPAPQPQGQPHAPSDKPRIDQVRAELDELSDYLRKEQGR
ncbi:hypothetical protein [Streptomyces sp. NPDC096193]|uniref:hypothetical protein n=1 Tax=Streptomyces sp. NPDC096193 TaxID=3155821 RepID=UPI00331B0B7B